MTAKPHTFYCGEAARQDLPKGVKSLRMGTAEGCHFSFDLRAFETELRASLAPAIADLHIVAGYVLAADMAVCRGGATALDTSGGQRSFNLRIPVTDPDRWNAPSIKSRLRSAVNFLSGDTWAFEFTQATRQDHVRGQLGLFPTGALQGDPQAGGDVMMFSGGIDSFTGLLDVLKQGERSPILVTHNPGSTHLSARQRTLLEGCRKLFPDANPRQLNIGFEKRNPAVWAHETTLRTRTLMYVALGTAAAHWARRDRILFFENGVVALNLPLSAQITQTMATRTAHPQALGALSELVTELLDRHDRPLRIENPWLFMSRGDVLRRLDGLGGAALLPHTVSCAHAASFLDGGPIQCGRCSQCIDRRFAAAAVGLSEYDPVSGYREDLRDGSRRTERVPRESVAGRNKLVLTEFVLRAWEHANWRGAADMLNSTGEANRALREAQTAARGQSPGDVAEALADLHRRHGLDVIRATEIWRDTFGATLVGRAEPGSLLDLWPQGQGPSSKAPPDSAKGPVRRFELRNERLYLAFPGDQPGDVPDDEGGFKYIEYLLAHPTATPSPFEVLLACGRIAENVPPPAQRVGRGGKTTLLNTTTDEATLKRQFDKANQDGDVATADRIKETLRLIQDDKQSAYRGGDVADGALADRKRLRQRLDKAIQRAERKLGRRSHGTLAAHLKAHIRVSASTARYTAAAEGTWQTSYGLEARSSDRPVPQPD